MSKAIGGYVRRSERRYIPPAPKPWPHSTARGRLKPDGPVVFCDDACCHGEPCWCGAPLTYLDSQQGPAFPPVKERQRDYLQTPDGDRTSGEVWMDTAGAFLSCREPKPVDLLEVFDRACEYWEHAPRSLKPEIILYPGDMDILGPFLHGFFDPEPDPGPPYVHTFTSPEPIGEDEEGDPIYPPPGPAYTLTEDG